MILPIVTEPNPVLHQVADPIAEITPEIQELAATMRETMHNAHGVGLAAPQVGRSVALCVIELNYEDSQDKIPFMALINPRVTWHSPKKVGMEEGCLSIPGFEGKIRRPESVRVKAKNLQGETIEIRANGYLARVLQHEIDHLNGILYTSYLKPNQLRAVKPAEYPRI